MVHSRGALVASGLVIAMSACTTESAEPARNVVVTDSAGVRIVESLAPSWGPGAAWAVSSEPIFRIGQREGAEPFLFDQVMGVSVLDDGRVVVANMGDNTLRFYSPDGEYLLRSGGSGEGPTEFLQIMSLYRIGDELWANQFSTRPLKIFDLQGGFVRSVTPPLIEGFRGSSVRGILSDGSLLFGDWPQGYPVQPGLYEGTSTYLRVSPDGSADTVGVFPASRFNGVEGRFGYNQPYGGIGAATAGGTKIYWGYNERYEIDVYAPDGTLERRMRRPWEPIPVTEADRQRWRTDELGVDRPDLSERTREQLRMIADAVTFPEHFPAYAHFRPDRVGNLWVRETAPHVSYASQRSLNPVDTEPLSWSVFDSTGVWLGDVTMPGDFRVLEIGDGHVAGIHKDDLGVESVTVYRLLKPGS